MKNSCRLLSVLMLLFSYSTLYPQNVGIGTNTPHSSAKLDIVSTSSGILIPRMSTAQRTAISTPASGLLVYDLGTKSFWYFDTSWKELRSSGNTLDQAYDQGGAGAGRIITADNGAVLIQGSDGFQVSGTHASGALLTLSGAGSRMFFYPRKSAFRAGYAGGTDWNEANIGAYSFATGYKTLASGPKSTAIGDSARATGTESIAMGSHSKATSYRSMVLGYYSVAKDTYSTAIGNNDSVTGKYGVGIGTDVVVTGRNAAALGNGVSALGEYSLALGTGWSTARGAVSLSATASGVYSLAMNYSTASGTESIAMGNNSKATSYRSMALGYYSVAKDTYSTAIGYSDSVTGKYGIGIGSSTTVTGAFALSVGNNIASQSAYEVVLGRYNTSYTPMSATSWNSADRLFVVGNGSSGTSRSDAMVILKNGNTGIGTSTPGAKLDVDGTAIFNESGAALDFRIESDTRSHAFFVDGSTDRIGLGLSAPGADLHIKQGATIGSRGIRIELDANSNHWDTYIDGADDYNFSFNGTLKSYINDFDGSYVQASDRRLKENIRPLGRTLDKVSRLNAYRYNFIGSRPEQISYGLISQEVELYFPEMVQEKNGYKMISYNQMIPVLLESVKELNGKIRSLEQRIADLEKIIQDKR